MKRLGATQRPWIFCSKDPGEFLQRNEQLRMPAVSPEFGEYLTGGRAVRRDDLRVQPVNR